MRRLNRMNLTIVMYHYVRKLKGSLYPDIKGLEIDLFKEQIRYLKKHYNIISAYDLLDAVSSGYELPPRALLLTFDDGYIDHFSNVFPVLIKEKISGCFFPVAKTVVENCILDVNKIHYILASVENKNVLVNYINHELDLARSKYHLKSNQYYWQKCGGKSIYDTESVIFVKRILQRDLPNKFRLMLLDKIFKKFVSMDEKEFSKTIYMDIDQISHLRENGMYIGNHGYEHCWLNSISPTAQIKEIDLSLDFMKKVGSDIENWIMCYPYGGYNDSLLSVLREKNCRIGLSVEVGIANLINDNLLTLPRLDTNSLPKNPNEGPNSWTEKAISGIL